MTKRELIENMESVMMDLVKHKQEFEAIMTEDEITEYEEELKATSKAFNFLLNRTYKNNRERISRSEWVYEVKIEEERQEKINKMYGLE